MRSEGIFSSPCLNYLCWAGSDPQVRDLALSTAVWEVAESKTFPMAGSVRALAHHCLIWGWVWVPGNAQLDCGSLAPLDFLPASNGVNDRKIWLGASLGSSLPLFGGVGSCILPGEFAIDHPCNYYQGSGFMRDLNTGFILLQTHCRESLVQKSLKFKLKYVAIGLSVLCTDHQVPEDCQAYHPTEGNGTSVVSGDISDDVSDDDDMSRVKPLQLVFLYSMSLVIIFPLPVP